MAEEHQNQQIRKTKLLIQTVALVFFILQVTLALQHYIAKPTMTTLGSKSLFSHNKPLLIAVCKTSQYNYTRGDEIGYRSSSTYFAGHTNDKTVLSWTGQHGNLTLNETFYHVMNPGIENIEFEVTHSSLKPNPSLTDGKITERYLMPNGLCKVYERKPLEVIHVKFSDKGPSEYFVFVSDQAAANPFQLPYSLLTGDKIRLIVTPGITKFVDYNIKLTETIVNTDDGSCVDYPTQTHRSYTECVDAELRAEMLSALGCMVPWMSTQDHCTGLIQRSPKQENFNKKFLSIIRRSWGGIQYKSHFCPLSCTLVSAHAMFQQEGIGTNINRILLDFEEDMKIENILLEYSFTALLVEIGSCLGLWLGKPYKYSFFLSC